MLTLAVGSVVLLAVLLAGFNASLRAHYRASATSEYVSTLNMKDSRDVVVLAVGTAYLQAMASAARLETVKAQLASAEELEQQTASRVKSELSPEIDALRLHSMPIAAALSRKSRTPCTGSLGWQSSA